MEDLLGSLGKQVYTSDSRWMALLQEMVSSLPPTSLEPVLETLVNQVAPYVCACGNIMLLFWCVIMLVVIIMLLFWCVIIPRCACTADQSWCPSPIIQSHCPEILDVENFSTATYS